MTFKPAILLLSAVCCTTVGIQVPDDAVAYSMSPETTGDSLTALSVVIRFRGDGDGETRLLLPREWAGSDELWRQVTDVRVDGASAVREDGPAARVITHRSGAQLTVSYRVVSAYAADPGFEYAKARPLIHPDWFFFHGEGVFAVPEERLDAPARFSWLGFPQEWKIASDLDHFDHRAATVRDVVESVAIGAPDLTIVERDTEGAPLRIAMRGRWRFEPTALAEAVARIVVHSNRLWKERPTPFLVTLAPLGGSSAGLSYTGTSRADAFSIASTPAFELAGAVRFLAHEFLHNWFPPAFGGALTQDEPRGYWFSEGFTDYYAGLVLLRAGVWSLTDYFGELNRTLLRHATSPARTASAAEIVQRFWTDQNVQQLPYDRGHLLAHLLENRIRAATSDSVMLRDVLLAQRSLAHLTDESRRAAPIQFPVVLRQATGIDVEQDLARYVENGEMIILPHDLFGQCATVTTLTQPDFDRGFDVAATNRAGGVLSGVDSTSRAYAAGLRNGMRLIRRESGVTGDSSVELVYLVADESGERLVRYFPAGTRAVTLQRVTPTAGSTTAGCQEVRRLIGFTNPAKKP